MAAHDQRPPNPKDSEGGTHLRRAAAAVRTAVIPLDTPYPEMISIILGGKYRIERVLGEGGMAVVFAALHLELDEIVAIKFLRREFRNHPDVVERFTYESRAAVRIKSDHVAKVFDVGSDPFHGPYIVMEYLEGRDLADVLFDRGKLEPEEAVRLILQAAEGIAVAHRHGIVHLDLKPDNLFLTRKADGSDLVKVLDFGVARALRAAAVKGTDPAANADAAMGSPAYMAPEQIRFEDPDHRSDIWGLGVVLYQLLTGRQAFSGATPTQTIRHVALSTPTPIRTHAPDVPDGLVGVVARCIERNLPQRFQNVAELAAALAPFGGREGRVTARQCVAVVMASGQALDIEIPASIPPPPPTTVTQPVWEVRPTPSRARRAAPLVAIAVAVLGLVVFLRMRAPAETPAAMPAPTELTATPTLLVPTGSAMPHTTMPPTVVPADEVASTAARPASTDAPRAPANDGAMATATAPAGSAAPVLTGKWPAGTGPHAAAAATQSPSSATPPSADAAAATATSSPTAVKPVEDRRTIGVVD